MLKKTASGVLTSRRGSEVLEDIFRSPRSILRANGHTKCGWYLLASPLAAALLDDLFEHPAQCSPVILDDVQTIEFQQYHKSFSADS
jgi:hypothetical protein